MTNHRGCCWYLALHIYIYKYGYDGNVSNQNNNQYIASHYQCLLRILTFCWGNVRQQVLSFEIRLTILKIFWVIETQNKNLFAVYLLNVCTQSLRQNEKWELLNDVCTNVSLELLTLFVSKNLLLISLVLGAKIWKTTL